ncbi:MAG: hypothetical protein V4471_07420 [Pseudomonadota bacterium]
MPSTPKTSNFLTLTPLTGGLPGTAAAAFTASTEDDEATLTKVGYINDLTHEQFQSLLYYISQEGESKDFKGFYSTLAEALPNYSEDIMTLAQQLKQEGREEGRYEVAKNLLAEGMSVELVKKLTKLPDLDLIELEKA